MIGIRNAAYMAITLHFLRKIAARIIPSTNVRYMVTAIHPNRNVGGYGKISDNVLIIVLAQAVTTVESESISPSTLWTTLLLPVNKVADYAKTNGIRYIMPIWDAPMYQFHGNPSATKLMHDKLVGLSTRMSTAAHKRLHDMAGAIQIIRDRTK